MKAIFPFLLLTNILFAIAMYYQSNQQNRKSVSPVMNPEKIILLPAEESCIKWGTFSGQSLSLAEAAISKLGLKRPYKKTSSTSLTKYRVHTPPFENREAVEREINKLRNMGIISYRVREQGPWLNAIFFGDLEDKTAAQNLLNKLNSKGITNVAIHTRSIEQKKLLFFEADTDNIAKLQNLATQFTGSKLVHTTCERL
ncbi:SPOR domain-containing protein [Nitrosomonas aestuarii]|uniref:SPOR domain-containing protein n=1 Tax=Nitrosomonas aestuarii TaxID=52441 RepID=UPI000D315517|nr:SPOR domain-containing protein [Nitrosomonas aestuarii]PTN11703.1 sporulation related protein [Nitrosomonas aestuarii]